MGKMNHILKMVIDINPKTIDLKFIFNDVAVKQFASQGQLKSYILALKLAQYELLRDQKGIAPILLLDEVCSHLDEINRNVLLTLIETFKLQIFMTGTSKNLFSFLSTNANFCNITD